MKIRVLKIEIEGLGSSLWVDAASAPDAVEAEVESLLDSAEPGSRLILTLEEMERGVYESLPEFEGW